MATDQSFLSNEYHAKMAPVTQFPSFTNHLVVTTAKTATAPSWAKSVIISADADIWLSDGTAAIPAGDVVDGTGSFLMKDGQAECFDITPGQTISIISASGTANVGLRFFA